MSLTWQSATSVSHETQFRRDYKKNRELASCSSISLKQLDSVLLQKKERKISPPIEDWFSFNFKCAIRVWGSKGVHCTTRLNDPWRSFIQNVIFTQLPSDSLFTTSSKFSSPSPSSLPLVFFFHRKFFSRALMSERLEQAIKKHLLNCLYLNSTFSVSVWNGFKH